MEENGIRVGGYLLVRDLDSGVRFAVRPGAVNVLHDQDPCCDATVLVLSGGRTVRVGEPLDTVLAWLSPGPR